MTSWSIFFWNIQLKAITSILIQTINIKQHEHRVNLSDFHQVKQELLISLVLMEFRLLASTVQCIKGMTVIQQDSTFNRFIWCSLCTSTKLLLLEEWTDFRIYLVSGDTDHHCSRQRFVTSWAKVFLQTVIRGFQQTKFHSPWLQK